MTGAVGKMLREELARSGRSLRKAAAEIGISHTTLRRIMEGDIFDHSTAQKLAAWLEVPVSTLVDLGGSGTDALAAQIAAVLHQEPRLAEIFARAMERVLAGQMSQDSFRELLSYTAFCLDQIPREENDNAASTDEQRKDAPDARLQTTGNGGHRE